MARKAQATTRGMTNGGNAQTERVARRLSRQQKLLEKELHLHKGPVTPTGRPVKHQDLINIDPLTDTQADFFDSYEGDEATGYVLYGSAGTGKTFLALWSALNEVLNPNSPFARVVIIRSTVATREMGFLPGTIEEKTAIYEQPYVSMCSDLFKRKDAYEKLKEMGYIEFMSSSFLRGSTLNDCIVVADELQNTTFSECSTIITRLGNNAKIIVCGDGAQDDLTKNKNDVSGFRDFVGVSKKMEDFRHFRFTTDDIVRSGFVKSWLIACEKMGL